MSLKIPPSYFPLVKFPRSGSTVSTIKFILLAEYLTILTLSSHLLQVINTVSAAQQSKEDPSSSTSDGPGRRNLRIGRGC